MLLAMRFTRNLLKELCDRDLLSKREKIDGTWYGKGGCLEQYLPAASILTRIRAGMLEYTARHGLVRRSYPLPLQSTHLHLAIVLPIVKHQKGPCRKHRNFVIGHGNEKQNDRGDAHIGNKLIVETL